MRVKSPHFVYADYHATTPIDPRVAAEVSRVMSEHVGNASSADHVAGDWAESAVEASRELVAALIGAEGRDIIFTAGATESINLALQGFVRRESRKGRIPRVAVSSVEHRAVLETARALARDGLIELSYLGVDAQARIDLDEITNAARSGLDLLAVMAANNEVGTVYPINEIANISNSYGVAFLCDASQAVGKVPVSVHTSGVTFLAFSAHKMYGPLGVGALFVAPGEPLDPITYGGGQERSLRPGTLNVPGIVGFGEAARLRMLESNDDERRIAQQRNALQQELMGAIDGVSVNGAPNSRLAGNLHISIPGVPNDLVIARTRERVAIATGAACTSGLQQASHVLRAMGLSRAAQESALRIGLGKFNRTEELPVITRALADAVVSVRKAITA